jgi:hypothetical protein
MKEASAVMWVTRLPGRAKQAPSENLAGLQVVYRHPSAILPVFAARNINEQRSDEKGIFLLDRGAHSR